jgi:transposase InsO family protein
MLFCFDAGLKTILRTDACNYGIGGVLLQVKEDQERPVGFFSRALTAVEQLYSTVEQEALGIVSAVKHFHYYLAGRRFVIQTDSKNNTFIHTCNNPKVLRWRLLMQDYDYSLEHLAASGNQLADHLSRAFRVQNQDKIETVHSAVAGHLGIAVTLKRLEEQGWKWPSMRQDVTTFLQQCPVCAKTRTRHPLLPLEPRSVEVWEPFESVSIDFIGPLPEDGDNNKYIIAAIDNFTRFVELTPTKDCTAFSAARALLALFSRYGAPLEVRSDQGPHFSAEIIRQFLGLCDIRQRFSLPYHPQANGIVERAIQECNRHLRAIVMEQRVLQNWSSVLPLVQRIMNSTVHSSIGVAPATLLYGLHCNLDRNLFSVPAGDLDIMVVDDYLQGLIKTQESLVRASQRHQAKVIDTRLEAARPEEMLTTFKVGDTVLLRPPHDRPDNKLAPRILGPYKVVSKTGTNTYQLRAPNAPDSDDPIDAHAERLVPYMPPRGADPADILAADRLQEYLVEEIRRHRRLSRGNTAKSFEYLVKWEGYEETTWEPSSSLKDNILFLNYLIANGIQR